ncbi:MAG: hypothetical protein U0441_33835 [Polyangiaceae bacterium]
MKFPSTKTGRAASQPRARTGALAPSGRRRSPAMMLCAGALAATTAAGCFALGVGIDPPSDELYYPTALLTSPGRHALYVVNSDFDIQYTGGTVQAIDLDSLRTCVSHVRDLLQDTVGDTTNGVPLVCANAGLVQNDNPFIFPGPCSPIKLKSEADTTTTTSTSSETDPQMLASACKDKNGAYVTAKLIKEARVIGAFASSATLTHAVDDAGAVTQRMFVAVRGDPSVTYFDTTDDDTEDGKAPPDPFKLDCRQSGDNNQCARSSRLGVSKYQTDRLIALPTEPVGIAASDDGVAIVTVHQTAATTTNSTTGGQASLLVNHPGAVPTLEFTLAGLPNFPQDVAAIPTSKFVDRMTKQNASFDSRPGFLVTFRAAAEIDLLRFFNDSVGTSRDFLQRVGAFSIATNSDGTDSRGIAISAADRKACEAKCADDDDDCLRLCVDVPLEVFIANRAPASLLIGKLTTEIEYAGEGQIASVTEQLNINDMVPLSTGASRVAVANVLDKDNKLSPRVFAMAFDSRYVVIYDPAQHRVEATVRTGRGPHAMAFDVKEPDEDDPEGHAFLYVAHFTDSYIGVIDLRQKNPADSSQKLSSTYGSMFATVGIPNPPKESQ